MRIDRRNLLKLAGLTPLPGMTPDPMRRALAAAATSESDAGGKADYTFRMGRSLIELAADHIVSATVFNGQFPGPLLRFKEGKRVLVDLYNDTDRPEQLHWHGQFLPVDVDGAAEERTAYIEPHKMRRIAFTPGPPGVRFYHTHLVAADNLSIGLYSGLVGPGYMEPQHSPGGDTTEKCS